MAASVGSVSIDLDAKIAKFESDIGRAARLLEKEISRAASVAERAMQRASREISAEVDKIAKKAEQFGKQVLAYFAVSTLVDYARGLAAVADSFANIQAKVKLATGGQVDLAKATEEVYGVAQRTYGSFEATAALVQRTAGALRNAGRGYQEAFTTGIQLAEVFNKALVVSGASTSEAISSAQQFSQALASGKFQGDEFRSVMENNSRFAKLLADSLGITIAQLREMSTAGKLNVESMLGVLKNTAALDAEFAKMPVTIGRATQQLSNAWTKFIGESDQASGASRRVAAAIQSIGDNLPQIVNALVTLGEIAVAVFATKMAGAAVQAGKAIFAAAAQAIAAETVYRALAVSTEAAAVASTRAATAMAALGAAGRGMLAFVGGIPGLLIAGAAALVYFATRSNDVSEEVDRLEKKAADLEKRAFTLGDAIKYLTTGAEPAAKSMLEMKLATLAAYESQMRSIEAAEKSGTATKEMGEQYLLAGQWADVLRGEIEKLNKAQAEVNLSRIKAEFSDFIRVVMGSIDAAVNWRQSLARSVVANPELAKEAEQMEKAAAKLGKTQVQFYEWQKSQDLAAAALKNNVKEGTEAYKILSEQIDKNYAANIKAAKAYDDATASVKAHKQEIREEAKEKKDAEKATNQYAQAMDRLSEYANAYTKDLGARSKVESEHVKRLDDIKEKEDKAIASARGLTNAKQLEADARARSKAAIDSESKAYAANLKELEKQKNISGPILKGLQDRAAGAWMSDRDSAAADAVKQLHDAYNNLDEELQRDLLPTMGQMEQAIRDQAIATYEAEKSAAFWRSTWDEAIGGVADAFGQFASGQIRSAKDLGKALQDVFKQTFQKIVAEMVRSGIMKMFASFFGGGSGGGGGFWTSLMGAAAAYLGGSGTSSGVSLSQNTANGGIDLSAQQTGGFQYGGGGSGGGGGGSSAANYAGNIFLDQAGNYVLSGAAGAWLNANPGLVGTGAAWGGAVAGAYYGYQQGDGGIGTAGSTAAGAIAGYYAGTVAAGAILGASGAVAAGGAATAGAASGAAGAAAAIPIVGWVAAIALIVDSVTGGAIFGSRYKPNELRETVNFGEDGASANIILNEWKYTSQGRQALNRFGLVLPSDWKDMEFRNRALEVPPEMREALEKFFESLGKTAIAAANKLNTDIVGMVDASFTTTTFFDRDAKIERTETVGTILGKQYKEDWATFQKRMHAEILIATLEQLKTDASKLAEAYRENADALMDAAQTMVQAQADLQDGKGLLGGGDSLESVFNLVEAQRVGDESLFETYSRLASATANYRAILEKVDEALHQLTATGTASDQMRVALEQIDKQLADNIEGLNAAAEAAGLAGAAEEDLAKLRALNAAQIDKLSGDFFSGIDSQISQLRHLSTPAGDFASAMDAIAASMRENETIAHMLARAQGRSGASASELYKIYELGARQMAAAIAKLQDIGKQQARSLGYLGLETVSDYDTRIEQLENQAAAAAEASSAVNGFGGAMESVAQSATDAMNLLLGNLSPLNDQQKLQIALGGLSAGTASPEQVLEIGRRLYASTQQYTDLFNQVMNMRPRGATGGGSGGGRTDGNTAKPLTAAEEEELRRLRVEREEKIKQQRFAEATEFANTVASLAAAQGISFQQVADNIGFNLEDLGKDLGLSMDDLLKYLDGIDVEQTIIPDSITSNFDRLLAALDKYWGNGSGYYNNVEHDPTTDKYDANGRLVNPNRGRRPGPTGDASGDTSDRKEPDNVIAGLDNYTRVIADNGNRNTQQIVESTDRNTEAVRDLSRDMREGFGNQPRGTRWERDTVRV